MLVIILFAKLVLHFLLMLHTLNLINYYLILQKRLKEATIVYNKIKAEKMVGNNASSLELQYDYLTVFLNDINNSIKDYNKNPTGWEDYIDIDELTKFYIVI